MHRPAGTRPASTWHVPGHLPRPVMLGVLIAWLVAALVIAALMGLPSPRASAATQRFVVPKDGSFTVVGHGFGHGHGLSQYGAQGAARAGRTSNQILDYYYPGTARAQAPAGWLMVLLTADTTPDLQVVAASGLSVYDVGGKRSYALPTSLHATRWRLTTSAGKTVVQYLRDGTWRAYRPGGRSTLVGDGELRSTAGRMTLVLPDGSRRAYRGYLWAQSPSKGSSTRRTVNVLRIDDYVRGVVASEMPSSWKPAALQAQAVAARTYARYEHEHRGSRGYSLCDTSACQVYGGIARETTTTDAAVKATAGRIRTWRGAAAFTQFGSSSGGFRASGGQPYLPARADAYDGWSGNPVHFWTRAASARTLQQAWPRIGTLRTISVTGRQGVDAAWGGRATRVVLGGSRGSVTVSGDDVRRALGLRSSWFAFKA